MKKYFSSTSNGSSTKLNMTFGIMGVFWFLGAIFALQKIGSAAFTTIIPTWLGFGLIYFVAKKRELIRNWIAIVLLVISLQVWKALVVTVVSLLLF